MYYESFITQLIWPNKHQLVLQKTYYRRPEGNAGFVYDCVADTLRKEIWIERALCYGDAGDRHEPTSTKNNNTYPQQNSYQSSELDFMEQLGIVLLWKTMSVSKTTSAQWNGNNEDLTLRCDFIFVVEFLYIQGMAAFLLLTLFFVVSDTPDQLPVI